MGLLTGSGNRFGKPFEETSRRPRDLPQDLVQDLGRLYRLG
jgi:hypothetical protein